MIYVCELLTREPEGGSAMIPLRIFLDLYGYLADLDCSGEASLSQSRAAHRFPARRDNVRHDRFDNESGPQLRVRSDGKGRLRERRLREKRPSKSLEILRDYEDDPEHFDIDIALARQSVASDKTEIEIESIDGHVFRGRREGTCDIHRLPTVEAKFGHSIITSIIDHVERNGDVDGGLPECSVDERKTTDDAFELNLGYEDGVAGREGRRRRSVAELRAHGSILRICRRSAGVSANPRASSRPEPPKEYFSRGCERRFEAGRLETIFRVSGIGPPVSPERVTAVGLWLADCARRQEGLVGPRNIHHFLCPNPDDIPECDCT
ncbi:uncharacterized protein [Cardiocondyla obscurior]|uniref:uncharacterized protein n=1 Tax=Cardiocondyla obscurior TaxID=286306 RepID=UPI00396582BF